MAWINFLTGASIACFGVSAQAFFDDEPLSEVHRAHYGDNAHGTFGYAVTGLGDVNADGHDDYAIGAPANESIQGWVGVFSGDDGNLIHQWSADTQIDLYGLSLANAGDVDNDGVDDLVIGSPGFPAGGTTATGMVEVRSGASGDLLHQWLGTQEAGSFGMAVSSAGDVNGDGYTDVIVGSKNHDGPGQNAGRAHVLSGESGAVLFTMAGTAAQHKLGCAVAGMGDLNGDGFDDVLVGAFGENRVYLVDARHDSIIHTFTGTDDGFGWSAANAGDVNSDGINDVVIGAFPPPTDNQYSSGHAFIYDGDAGDLIHQFNGSSRAGYGYAVAPAGDIDLDGYDDVLIGAPGHYVGSMRSGRVEVRSGDTGSLLDIIQGGTTFTEFGTSLAALGDVDGDNVTDFIIGASAYNQGGDDGAAFVFLGSVPESSFATGSFTAVGSDSPGFLLATHLDYNNAADTISLSRTNDRMMLNINKGDGRFYAGSATSVGNGPSGATAADFNKDGRPDLALALAGDRKIALYRSAATGLLVKEGTLRAGQQTSAVVAADFNGDGRPDLAASNRDGQSVCVWLRKSSPSTHKLNKQFKPKINYAVGIGVAALHAGDVDGNNKPDLLAVHADSGIVSVLTWAGGGLFSPRVDSNKGAAIASSCAADFNGDELVDLALSRPASTSIELWLSNGTGSLVYSSSLDLGVVPTNIVAVDLDHDGAPDIATANNATHNVAIAFNDGSGSLGSVAVYPTGFGPVWITACDADGDEDIDLITVNAIAQSIAVLKNEWFN